MTDPTIHQQRPLSPHLQIYRPQITSMMSIFHRFTGLILFGGVVVIALWLWSAAYAQEMFTCLHGLLTSTLGTIGMIIWTTAFFYHLFNGVRHLLWDTGQGFDLGDVTLTGITAFAFTILATASIWWLILGAGI